eukprot:g6625.t1
MFQEKPSADLARKQEKRQEDILEYQSAFEDLISMLVEEALLECRRAASKGCQTARYDFQHSLQRHELGSFLYFTFKRNLWESSQMRGWYYQTIGGEEIPEEARVARASHRPYLLVALDESHGITGQKEKVNKKSMRKTRTGVPSGRRSRVVSHWHEDDSESDSGAEHRASRASARASAALARPAAWKRPPRREEFRIGSFSAESAAAESRRASIEDMYSFALEKLAVLGQSVRRSLSRSRSWRSAGSRSLSEGAGEVPSAVDKSPQKVEEKQLQQKEELQKMLTLAPAARLAKVQQRARAKAPRHPAKVEHQPQRKQGRLPTIRLPPVLPCQLEKAGKVGKGPAKGKGPAGKGKGKGKGKEELKLRKPKIKPSQNMKQLWWTRFLLGKHLKEGETIWDLPGEEEIQLQIHVIENRFGRGSTSHPAEEKTTAKKEKETLKAIRIITDPNLIVGKDPTWPRRSRSWTPWCFVLRTWP